MGKLQKIEVIFPVPVDLPAGWERVLDGLVEMVCEMYEAENPDRTMWPAGMGSKPIWREPEEPNFDDNVYCVEVAEREAYPKEIERREWQKMTPEQRRAKVEADRRDPQHREG
jgi:hypothetical protein